MWGAGGRTAPGPRAVIASTATAILGHLRALPWPVIGRVAARRVTEPASDSLPEEATGGRRLGLLLAMAMFVLVVDTSLINVSISAVVRDLDTTVSGVQSAIALEALV
jgi:hypothetical protein